MIKMLSYLRGRLAKLKSDPQAWQHHRNMQKIRQRIQDTE